MPIYEFECVAKGHIFDRLQKMADPDPETCEVCGQGPVRRRVTAPAFRLSGTGWYETDFKGAKDNKRNLAGDSSSDSGSKDSAAKESSNSEKSSGSSESPSSKSESKAASSSD